MATRETDIFTPPVPECRDGIYRALKKSPKVPIAQKTNFFPLTASLYEPLWRKRSLTLLTGGDFSTPRELELMLEWLKPQPGETVLDAACSAGLYARTLLASEADLQVHALDFSVPFLEKAREYSIREGVKPVLVQADVRALPYRDRVFDALVCGGSLNEFTDLPGTLGEFARVLKPGGRMWQMYLTKAESTMGKVGQSMTRLSGLRFIDPASLEKEASKVGFQLIKSQYRGPVTLTLFATLERSARGAG